MYGSDFPAHSDFKAEDLAKSLKEPNSYVLTSSILVVMYARVLVKEGFLDSEKVRFEFYEEGTSQLAYSDGGLKDPPESDFFEDALERFI